MLVDSVFKNHIVI